MMVGGSLLKGVENIDIEPARIIQFPHFPATDQYDINMTLTSETGSGTQCHAALTGCFNLYICSAVTTIKESWEMAGWENTTEKWMG